MTDIFLLREKAQTGMAPGPPSSAKKTPKFS